MFRYKLSAIVFCITLLSACKPSGKDDFNRAALLNNVYSTVIVPDFQNFHSSVEALKAATDTFLQNPSQANLTLLKNSFASAYLSFQAVELYTFTPSMDLMLALNSFPPDTNRINLNIQSGTYDLNTVNNLRAKGFPAIDYLLFGKSSSETITDFASVNRKNYLKDIVLEIASKSGTSATDWSNYETTFVGADGIDVGSSVGMLVNDLCFEMERNRRERVGNALGYVGVVTGGVLLPESVEAYYSQQSKALLVENLSQLKSIYTGNTGIGFDDYLDYIGADYNGAPLSAEIATQFDKAIAAAQNVPVHYSEAVTSHNAEMQTLFLELKKLTVLLKVDMSSNLGVVINYSDNDGD